MKTNLLKKENFQEILELYDIGKYMNHNLLEDVLENDVYILKTNKGKYILKVLKNVNLKDFREQLDLIDFLHKKKVLVVKNIKDKKSNEIIKYKNDKLIIQGFIEGIHPKRMSNILIKDIALNIAKMHLALLNSKFKMKRKVAHKYKKKDLTNCPKIDYVNKLQNNLISNLSTFKDKKLRVARIHSDLSEVNILVKNNKLKSFIDFDDSDYDYIVYELAIFIAHIFVRSKIVHKKKITLFLREYQKHIKLNVDEKNLLYYLVKYRLFGILYWYFKYTKLHPEKTKQFEKGINRSLSRLERFDKTSLESFLELC
tara:strand:- start:288 stop:1226 length:939 start_codon:yes stop_codon:yes gene_type:complete